MGKSFVGPVTVGFAQASRLSQSAPRLPGPHVEIRGVNSVNPTFRTSALRCFQETVGHIDGSAPRQHPQQEHVGLGCGIVH